MAAQAAQLADGRTQHADTPQDRRADHPERGARRSPQGRRPDRRAAHTERGTSRRRSPRRAPSSRSCASSRTPPNARAAQLRELYGKFQKMVDAGKLKVVFRHGRMLLELPNDVLFDSGKTDIKPEGKGDLSRSRRCCAPCPTGASRSPATPTT